MRGDVAGPWQCLSMMGGPGVLFNVVQVTDIRVMITIGSNIQCTLAVLPVAATPRLSRESPHSVTVIAAARWPRAHALAGRQQQRHYTVTWFRTFTLTLHYTKPAMRHDIQHAIRSRPSSKLHANRDSMRRTLALTCR